MSALTLKWRREAIAAGVFHGLSGQAKAVWDHLATTYANDLGIAYPGAVLLAGEMGLKERGLQRCMAELIKKGRIKKVSEAWPGHASRYRILPWPVSEANACTEMLPSKQNGHTTVHPSTENGRIAVHPLPDNGRTTMQPAEPEHPHNRDTNGHIAMREKGASSCAISRSDLQNKPHNPLAKGPNGDGVSGNGVEGGAPLETRTHFKTAVVL